MPEKQFKTIKVPKGTVLFKEGEQSKGAYLIRKGKVQLFKEFAGGRQELALFGNREIFGELSLFNGSPCGATAEAVENCELLLVSAKDMAEERGKCTPLMQALLDQLVQRLHGKDRLFEQYLASDGMEGRRLRLEQAVTTLENNVGEALADAALKEDIEFTALLGNVLVTLNSKEEG